MEKVDILDKKDPYAALRYREFRSYLGMRFFFTFAYQMQAVIIGFHIYHLTKDPLALGLVGLSEAIPAISIALYGGYVADKSEKRALLLKIFTCVFICSLVMLLVTASQVRPYVPESYVVPTMYLMVFGIGIARGFFSPATFSLMARIVPKSDIPQFKHLEQFQLAGCFHPGSCCRWFDIWLFWHYRYLLCHLNFHTDSHGVYLLLQTTSAHFYTERKYCQKPH